MASGNSADEGTSPSGSRELTRLIGALATVAIAASILIIIAISAAGPNVAVPVMLRAAGPPWWHALHLTATLVTVALWVALVLGCAGVIAGLVAVARGARPPVRAVMAAAFLALAVMTVLPPAGSTDAISYAANGRMAVIGHSPYVMTPVQLRRSGDPIGEQIPFSEIPSTWTTTVSVYGPVATGAEWVAAELGGSSLARITFWLKLEEALAFGAVIVVLDRMLRADPAQRLRAHLLWSVNPLLLWEIVASGHIDGLAASEQTHGFVQESAQPIFGRCGRRLIRGKIVAVAHDLSPNSFLSRSVARSISSRPVAIIHRASVPHPSRRPATGMAMRAKTPAGDRTRPALSAS